MKTALDAEGIELSVWCIHRKIGMSGGLFSNQLLREIEVEIDPERIELLRRGHAEAYQRYASKIRPLPGAPKLLVWFDSSRNTLGNRDQQPGKQQLSTLLRSRAIRLDTQSRIQTCSWLQRSSSTPRSRGQSSSATVSGTCSRPHAAGR